MAKEVQLVSAMSELGAGTRGASLGLQAIQVASLGIDPTFFHNRPVVEVPHQNERLFRPAAESVDNQIDGIADQYERMEERIAPVMQEGKFPFVFTGDHSNGGGTIAAIKKAFPDKRLGVIWIDAHADLHSPYTSPTGNVHGMPLATALADNNVENKVREPSQEVLSHWDRMKGDRQRVRHEDLFFIGLRDTEAPEDKLREKHGIPNITVEELRKEGVEHVAREALAHLKDCEILYVSFDVDSMDPSVSKGTGTPVEGGLWEQEAHELLQLLAHDQRLCCLEVTEVNPCLDTNGNAMAEAAFRIVKPLITQLESH